MIKRALALAAATTIVLAASGLTLAVPAEAATPKSYKNCAALNKAYPHGVAKKGAKDKTSRTSKPVTTFKVDSLVYAKNDGGKGEHDLDRDNDGVACEKR